MVKENNTYSKEHSLLKSALLSYLTATAKSEYELHQKAGRYLKKNSALSFDQKNKLTTEVIDELKEMNLVDDVEYANRYVKKQFDTKNPKSKFETSQFLRKKGISREIISQALEMYDSDIELELIEKVLKKKFRNNISLSDKNKAISYLKRRGFSYTNAKKSVQMHLTPTLN